MIKAVFFDLDDTLYSMEDVHPVAIQRLCEYCKEKWNLPMEQTKVGINESYKIVQDRLGYNKPDSHTRLLRCLDYLERNDIHSPSSAMEMEEIYWGTYYEKIVPENGILDFIDALKAASVIVGVGTNMTAYVQFKKIKILGIIDKLDYLITSEEVGIDKPDSSFFTYCVNKAKVSPEEFLFVGDSIEHDMNGAKSVGLNRAWYNPRGKDESGYDGAHIIHNYADLVVNGKPRLDELVFG